MPRRAKAPGSGGRTDTLTQPNRVPTGLPYGQNTQLASAQKALPLPQAAPPPSGAAASQVPPPAGAAPEPSQSPDVLGQATAMPYSEVGLGRPSDRPNEHVTTGLAGGPGPALQLPNAPMSTVGGLLDSLASAPGASADIKAMADMAKQSGA